MNTVGFKVFILSWLCSLCSCKSFNVSGNAVSKKEETPTFPDLFNFDDMGRTLDSIGNIGGMLMNLTMGMGGLNINSLTGNSSCGGSGADLSVFEAVKIPLYFIIPALIIGVVIAIKKIGFGIAWLPSVTAPFFHAFKSLSGSNDEQQGGYSPSPAYGAPAPSPVYGPGGASTLSRQTAILESIDNLNNQYAQPVGSSSDYYSSNTNSNDYSSAQGSYYNPADSNAQDYNGNNNNYYYSNNDQQSNASG